jgi:hypothetical protein
LDPPEFPPLLAGVLVLGLGLGEEDEELEEGFGVETSAGFGADEEEGAGTVEELPVPLGLQREDWSRFLLATLS